MEEVPRRTSLVPLAFPCFVHSFNRGGNKERFRLPGAGGGSFPLYGGTFARSYFGVEGLGLEVFGEVKNLWLPDEILGCENAMSDVHIEYECIERGQTVKN